MVAGYEDFRRVAHLDYVKLPGGAAAICEPWRMAVSYLAHHFGSECAGIDIPFLRGIDPRKLKLLLNMMERNVNSPLTSSCGRLFDAVAALAGIRQIVNYEAQAAIELENAITEPAGDEAYQLKVKPSDAGPWIIDTKPLFVELIDDLRRQVPVSMISAKFHQGLVDVFAHIAQHIREARKPESRLPERRHVPESLSCGAIAAEALRAFLRGVCALRGSRRRRWAEPGSGPGGCVSRQVALANSTELAQSCGENFGIEITRGRSRRNCLGGFGCCLPHFRADFMSMVEAARSGRDQRGRRRLSIDGLR